jgi:hypothetical protein
MPRSTLRLRTLEPLTMKTISSIPLARSFLALTLESAFSGALYSGVAASF